MRNNSIFKHISLFIIILSITLLSIGFQSFSQNIDSLENILPFKKNAEKAQTLNELAKYYKSISPNKSYQYANQAFILASDFKNYKEQANSMYTIGVIYYMKGDYKNSLYYWEKTITYRKADKDTVGVANCLSNIGLIYLNTGNSDKAIEYFKKALLIQSQLKNKKGMANAFENIGVANYNKGDYEKAIEHYQKSLKIEEELNNKLGLSQSLNSIAGVFLKMNNYDKALDYFQQSLKIKENLGDKSEIAVTLNNIGIVYENTNNIPKAINFYEKSLEYATKSDNNQSIANTLNNLGGIYLTQKKYQKALALFKKSLSINKKMGNNQGIASCYLHFADIYNHENNPESALSYSLQSLSIAKDLGIKDIVQKNYQIQADIYAKQNNFEKAHASLLHYISIKDSMINENNHKQITEIETKYQTEKKQKEIAFLNQQSELNELKIKKNEKEIQFQRFINYIILIGFVLILFISLLLYKQYIEKKTVNLKLEIQNKEISSQKEELERQKNIALQQRDQISEQKKHITDSILYAKKIQNAILPQRHCIENYFCDNFVLYIPKDIVSGDFYWFSTTFNDHNKIIIAAIDCTGHGVPGAFMSIVAYNLLKQAINEQKLSEPSEILNSLSKNLQNTLQLSDSENTVMDSMDISLCVIDKSNLNMEFAGAHNPVCIIRNDELIELKGNKYSIGEVFTDNFNGFDTKNIQLKTNDSIYLFSDGYVDQFGGKNRKKYLSRQFKKNLIDIQSLSMENQKELLERNFLDWKGNIEQYDDIMVIGLRINQNQSNIQETILLSYKGRYQFETIEELIKQAKDAINLSELKNAVKKKIINVLIECLENIHKYAIIDNDNAEILPQIFLIKKQNNFIITTKNLIANNQTELLSKQINLVNSLDKEGLKKMYEEIIDNGNISDKGGAGLGFIDMAVKSGNKIDYKFTEYNDETTFFELTIEINNLT